VVVDQMPNRTRQRPRAVQAENHVMAPEIVERELREAGFGILERRDRFIDNPDEERALWMIVAERPGSQGR
jgi:hypothetical protein